MVFVSVFVYACGLMCVYVRLCVSICASVFICMSKHFNLGWTAELRQGFDNSTKESVNIALAFYSINYSYAGW